MRARTIACVQLGSNLWPWPGARRLCRAVRLSPCVPAASPRPTAACACTHAHARTQAHAHTRTHTHARTHTRTRKRKKARGGSPCLWAPARMSCVRACLLRARASVRAWLRASGARGCACVCVRMSSRVRLLVYARDVRGCACRSACVACFVLDAMPSFVSASSSCRCIHLMYGMVYASCDECGHVAWAIHACFRSPACRPANPCDCGPTRTNGAEDGEARTSMAAVCFA